MGEYQVLDSGVLIRTFYSFQRLQEYLKDNFPNYDLAYLKLHGYTVREVNTNGKI